MDLAHQHKEGLEVVGFDHVGIRMGSIRSLHIRPCGRRRQHHHRYRQQRWVLLDRGQHLLAAQAGQVQVQQHQVRPGSRPIAAILAQKGQGLLARRHPVHSDGQLALGKCFLDQSHVGRVVLDQQEMHAQAASALRSHDARREGLAQSIAGIAAGF